MDGYQSNTIFNDTNQITIHGGHFTQNVGQSGNGFRALSREVAPLAFYNAGHDFDLPKCHPNTRVAVLKRVKDWTLLSDSLLWIYGAAGAGKSSIARTIAEWCQEERILLASFFFFRSDPLRNNFKRFIPTLAYDIIQSVPDCRSIIERVVDSDPHIFARSLDTQIYHLILSPLSQVAQTRALAGHPLPYVIIVDGLDECIETQEQTSIIQLFSKTLCQNPYLRWKVLIASRPELTIQHSFNNVVNPSTSLALSDDYTADEDIRPSLEDNFRDPLPVPSRFPPIAKDPDLTYVLMVGSDTNDSNFNPHFDWSRYLPSAVVLDRASHDSALDALFKYCTSFCLRIIPGLFLKDMYRVLSVPRSQETPKTAHYSPMLHNSIIALALAFSEDPRFRDLKARQYFIDAAKGYMEAECQKPTLAVVQALSFLGSFYGSQGNPGLGYIYFGLSARVAQCLDLNLDFSDFVERGLMEHSDKVDRNWALWSIFTSDVCWSLYVGRGFATSMPDDDIPLPYIDTILDEMPVAYGNLAPQPNYTTKTFHANAELFLIARDILEVNNSLIKTKARPIVVFDRVDYVDSKLNDWCASLPPDLQLTSKSRSTASPHKLLLHLSYWWLFILLHRPLFHYRTTSKASRQIDHVKICKRAADNIMEILKTWHELFGLRFSPITLIQIGFSAGTVYLLLALQACCGVRVAKKELDHAISHEKLVAEYLHEVGRSWPGANKIVEILKILVQKKLTPLLDKIPVLVNGATAIEERP